LECGKLSLDFSLPRAVFLDSRRELRDRIYRRVA